MTHPSACLGRVTGTVVAMDPRRAISHVTRRTVGLVTHPRTTARELVGDTIGLGVGAAGQVIEVVTRAASLISPSPVSERVTWPVDLPRAAPGAPTALPAEDARKMQGDPVVPVARPARTSRTAAPVATKTPVKPAAPSATVTPLKAVPAQRPPTAKKAASAKKAAPAKKAPAKKAPVVEATPADVAKVVESKPAATKVPAARKAPAKKPATKSVPGAKLPAPKAD